MSVNLRTKTQGFFVSLGGFLMRYVENGVREDFAKLTFKGLNVPLSELDEDEWLEDDV